MAAVIDQSLDRPAGIEEKSAASNHGKPVRISNLVKGFGGVGAVSGVDLAVMAGEVITLLGPSGCGKTTTLRCIAGLERPDSGEIFIGDRAVVSANVFVQPHARGIGMVFQSYALWPHMTTWDNIAYGLKLKKVPKREAADKIERALKLVGLSGYERRFPSQLSGGQQQRVALARSIVVEPSVLLLDEPLSNLDAKLRDRMRFELRDLLKRLGTTAIYVTHDQAESMVVSDRIVLMNEGKIVQTGTPRELYQRPADRFTVDFIGSANFMEGIVAAKGTDALDRIAMSDDTAVLCRVPDEIGIGDRVTAVIRPEDVRLRSATSDATNLWECRVRRSVYLGEMTELYLEFGALTLRARLPSRDVRQVQEACVVSVEPHAIICLPENPS